MAQTAELAPTVRFHPNSLTSDQGHVNDSPHQLRMKAGDMKKAATAATLAAVAATIFGTSGTAGAAGVPGDPTIPPVNGETQYNGYPTPYQGGTGVAPDQVVNVHVESVTTDASGNVVLDQTLYDNTTSAATAGATLVSGSAASTNMVASVDMHWSGCQSVDTSIALQNDYWLYTETLYRYHQALSWCGDGNGGINKNTVNHYDYVTEVAGLVMQVGPQIADNADFYNAWPGLGDYPKSGYNVFTQRRMDNCAFQVGCVKSTYPWVRNIGFADGAYWWDAGIG